jgi:hypothetical protein
MRISFGSCTRYSGCSPKTGEQGRLPVRKDETLPLSYNLLWAAITVYLAGKKMSDNGVNQGIPTFYAYRIARTGKLSEQVFQLSVSPTL